MSSLINGCLNNRLIVKIGGSLNSIKTDTAVIIKGIEIQGFIDEENFCPICSTNQIYYENFDSYFCPKCNYFMGVFAHPPEKVD